MKNSKGKGVIRLGDQTTHGGKVISGQATFKVLGKTVAVEGDITMCPQCKGTFPIQPASSERRHNDRPVAYDGDTAACGARLLSTI